MMSRTLFWIHGATTLFTRLAALVGGLICFWHFPWDMPLVMGHLGCLTLGLRIWMIELALLTIAAAGLPDFRENASRSC